MPVIENPSIVIESQSFHTDQSSYPQKSAKGEGVFRELLEFFEPEPVMGRDKTCRRMLSRRRVRSMSANDGAVFDVYHGHRGG